MLNELALSVDSKIVRLTSRCSSVPRDSACLGIDGEALVAFALHAFQVGIHLTAKIKTLNPVKPE